MGWFLSEKLSPSHPPLLVSQLNWEFLQAEGRAMVPSVQATLGGSGWLGTSRTSTTLPGAEQSQLPLSLGLSQGDKNSPRSQHVLAQMDEWRCQEFGLCVPWARSVTLPGVTRWQPRCQHLSSQGCWNSCASHLCSQHSLTCSVPAPAAAAGAVCIMLG